MLPTEEKLALRSRAIAARATLRAQARREATARIVERALERLLASRGVIGLFSPFRDEVDPAELIDNLAAHGRRLALPCTPKRGNPLVFRAFAPGDGLVQGRLGIAEPSPDAPEVMPHVLVVPPVAFDRRGYRIGYGAGFYDRTIPILRHLHPLMTLGLAFACQEVERVPDEQHDVPLDAIATDLELLLPGDH